MKMKPVYGAVILSALLGVKAHALGECCNGNGSMSGNGHCCMPPLAPSTDACISASATVNIPRDQKVKPGQLRGQYPTAAQTAAARAKVVAAEAALAAAKKEEADLKK